MGRIILTGLARSGTTFLAKLFDSHRDVFYKHEPDGFNKNKFDVPRIPAEQDYDTLEVNARKYIDFLFSVRDLKSLGKEPFFDKSYRSTAKKTIMVIWVYILKVHERAFKQKLRGNVVPEFKSSDKEHNTVLKLVASLGRTGLFLHTESNIKYVHIIRHPAGVAASRIRGDIEGNMQGETFMDELVCLPEAKQYNFTEQDIASFTNVQRYAYEWMLINDKVFEECNDKDNYVLVSYEALCQDTEMELRRVFDKCGLPWCSQTEEFIRHLEGFSSAKGRYYSVMRSPKLSANKWREELSEEQIAEVAAVVSQSKVANVLFAEYNC